MSTETEIHKGHVAPDHPVVLQQEKEDGASPSPQPQSSPHKDFTSRETYCGHALVQTGNCARGEIWLFDKERSHVRESIKVSAGDNLLARIILVPTGDKCTALESPSGSSRTSANLGDGATLDPRRALRQCTAPDRLIFDMTVSTEAARKCYRSPDKAYKAQSPEALSPSDGQHTTKDRKANKPTSRRSSIAKFGNIKGGWPEIQSCLYQTDAPPKVTAGGLVSAHVHTHPSVDSEKISDVTKVSAIAKRVAGAKPKSKAAAAPKKAQKSANASAKRRAAGYTPKAKAKQSRKPNDVGLPCFETKIMSSTDSAAANSPVLTVFECRDNTGEAFGFRRNSSLHGKGQTLAEEPYEKAAPVRSKAAPSRGRRKVMKENSQVTEPMKQATSPAGTVSECNSRMREQGDIAPRQRCMLLTDTEKADLQVKIDTFSDEQLHRAFLLLKQEVGMVPEGQDEVNLDIDGLPLHKQQEFLSFVNEEYNKIKRRKT